MEELNEQLRNIDFVDLSSSVKKSMLKNMPKLKEFMDHCCQIRHYSFCIKKCGQSDRHICKEPRLPPEVFRDLHMLPDPTPGDEAIIDLLILCMIRPHQKFTDLLFQSPAREERHSHSLPVFNMPRIPMYWLNASNVECGV